MTKARDLSKSTLPAQSGNSGKYLTTDGTVQSWGTVAAGKNYSLLNTGGTALTGTGTITISGISGMDSILVFIYNASSSANSASMLIRFNSDTGTNYKYAGSHQYGYENYNYIGSIFGVVQDNAATSYYLGQSGASASSEMGSGVSIEGANSTGIKTIKAVTGFSNHGYYQLPTQTMGVYSGSSAISSISFIASSGNFDNGTIYVYASA